MISQCFAVRDKAVGAFLGPFFVRSKGEAIRSFGDAVNDPKHQFARHLNDYALFQLGSFDDQSGMFTPAVEKVVEGFEVMDKLDMTAPPS